MERLRRREERERSLDAEAQALAQGLAANKRSDGLLRRRLVREVAACVARVFLKPTINTAQSEAAGPAQPSSPGGTSNPTAAGEFLLVPWWQAPLSPWAVSELLTDSGFLPRAPRLTPAQADTAVVRMALGAGTASVSPAAPVAESQEPAMVPATEVLPGIVASSDVGAADSTGGEPTGATAMPLSSGSSQQVESRQQSSQPVQRAAPWDAAAAAGDWAAEHPSVDAPHQSEAAADSMRWLVRVWGTLLGVSAADADAEAPAAGRPPLPALLQAGTVPAVRVLSLLQSIVTGAYDVRESVLVAGAAEAGTIGSDGAPTAMVSVPVTAWLQGAPLPQQQHHRQLSPDTATIRIDAAGSPMHARPGSPTHASRPPLASAFSPSSPAPSGGFHGHASSTAVQGLSPRSPGTRRADPDPAALENQAAEVLAAAAHRWLALEVTEGLLIWPFAALLPLRPLYFNRLSQRQPPQPGGEGSAIGMQQSPLAPNGAGGGAPTASLRRAQSRAAAAAAEAASPADLLRGSLEHLQARARAAASAAAAAAGLDLECTFAPVLCRHSLDLAAAQDRSAVAAEAAAEAERRRTAMREARDAAELQECSFSPAVLRPRGRPVQCAGASPALAGVYIPRYASSLQATTQESGDGNGQSCAPEEDEGGDEGPARSHPDGGAAEGDAAQSADQATPTPSSDERIVAPPLSPTLLPWAAPADVAHLRRLSARVAALPQVRSCVHAHACRGFRALPFLPSSLPCSP